MGHGIGLAIWEKPMISRLVSLEHSYEIKPGMVFALETFWPSKDGWSAARIEEEVVVTATGHEIITRFPAEKLLVCGAPYVTVDGPLETTRELEPAPNQDVVNMIAAVREVRGWRPVACVAIQIGRQAEGRLESVPEVRAVPGKGLEGDRYFRGEGSFSKNPGGGRQVTLVAQRDARSARARARHQAARRAETRRNLLTSGVPLNDLVGKEFQVGAVRMKGVRLAEPCNHLERLTQPGVLKGLVHRAGLRADILDEGVLRVGDAIVPTDPEALLTL